MKLSIVVPVYNVAKYLPKCLDSLLHQDIPENEYEIIVVNDGSTDGSGEIAAVYSSEHKNIILINQENKGLSGARNTGIGASCGKYIQFVDSDDFLEPDVEASLVSKMESENLDILRFNYQNVNENYEVFDPNKHSKQFVDYTDEVCDGMTFLNERLGPACYACQFIFRTDLVKSMALFREEIYFEDVEWTPRVICAAKRVTSMDTVVYNYYSRVGSITSSQTREKKLKSFKDRMSLLSLFNDRSQRIRDSRWYKGMISSIVISLLSDISINFWAERRAFQKEISRLSVYPLSYNMLNIGARRKVLIINISPHLYCLVIKLKNIL